MIPIRDNVPIRHVPFVVYLLVGTNVGLFLLLVQQPRDRIIELVTIFGAVPSRLSWAAFAGNPVEGGTALLSLLTSMFLHGGWMHMIGNMWILWLFGDNVEDRLGHGRFFLFYMLSGVAAMLSHVAIMSSSQVPAIGASGAVAAVMGAYFFLFPAARIVVLVPIFFLPLFFEVPAAFFLLVWMLTQIFGGTATLARDGSQAIGGVAFWAHIGGFAAGFIYALLFGRRKRRRR